MLYALLLKSKLKIQNGGQNRTVTFKIILTLHVRFIYKAKKMRKIVDIAQG